MAKKFGGGRSPARFSFTYQDLSEVTGYSAAAIRKHAQRGHFDPKDLLSVLEFVQTRLKKSEELLDLVEQARDLTKK